MRRAVVASAMAAVIVVAGHPATSTETSMDDPRDAHAITPVVDTGAPKPSHHATMVRAGTASNYGPGYSLNAWPGGRGWRLRVCGAAACQTIVSTDAGPNKAMQRAGRIIDLSVSVFERVTGRPWTAGLARVTVEVLGR